MAIDAAYSKASNLQKTRARKLFSNSKVAFRNRQYGYIEVYADSKLTNAVICKRNSFRLRRFMKLPTPIKQQCQHCEHEQKMTDGVEQCGVCGNIIVACGGSNATGLAADAQTAASSENTRRRYDSRRNKKNFDSS